MRKSLAVLGTLLLLTSASSAAAPGSETERYHPGVRGPVGASADQTLHRWAFNQAGRDTRDLVMDTCGVEPARSVRTKRTAGDITLAIVTLGLYTPVHAKVVCAPPERAGETRPRF